MLRGITSRLPGWRLAITGAKLLWNQSWKSSGSKCTNFGARAVKVRFKMVSLTPGFATEVMFLWKINRMVFVLRKTFTVIALLEWMKQALVAHVHCTLLYLWTFCLEVYANVSFWAKPWSCVRSGKKVTEPSMTFKWPVCRDIWAQMWHSSAYCNYSPDCWCLQKPGKTDWADHRQGTLSSFEAPP